MKKRLESVAASEGRSVAQICEAFIQAGLNSYERDGLKHFKRVLSRPKPDPHTADKD